MPTKSLTLQTFYPLLQSRVAASEPSTFPQTDISFLKHTATAGGSLTWYEYVGPGMQ